MGYDFSLKEDDGSVYSERALLTIANC